MLRKIIHFGEHHFSHYFARTVRLYKNNSVLKRNDSEVKKTLFINTLYIVYYNSRSWLLRYSVSSFTSETIRSRKVVQLETFGVVVLVHNTIEAD